MACNMMIFNDFPIVHIFYHILTISYRSAPFLNSSNSHYPIWVCLKTGYSNIHWNCIVPIKIAIWLVNYYNY